MKFRNILAPLLLAAAIIAPTSAGAYRLKSPDGRQQLTVTNQNGTLRYSLSFEGTQVVLPSALSLKLGDGTVWGHNTKVKRARKGKANATIASPHFIRSSVADHYNSLTLSCGDYDVEFRAYDQGVAYRFVSHLSGPYTIEDEEVKMETPYSYSLLVNTINAYDRTSVENQAAASYEGTYLQTNVAKWPVTWLGTNPLFVEAKGGIKLLLAESDLKDYPGMFLMKGIGECEVKGWFARAPKTTAWGGDGGCQLRVKEREPYIAKCEGPRTFPWRIILAARSEADFLGSDMVYALGAAPQGDYSWVKGGKAVWDWWSANKLEGVSFKPGMNTDTYLYRIDFAATHNTPLVLIDAGWSENNFMGVKKSLDLQKLIDYGRDKGVGIMLWAYGFRFAENAEALCAKYSAMGIKGFKLDFFDRNDQAAIATIEKLTRTAAKYKLTLDLHGCWPIAGFNRTYPNVLSFEGVHGLENCKWESTKFDQVTYDVTFPFARMVAAPADYTPGAMNNGNQQTFRVKGDDPMSKGTRCRQIAEYVVFFSPLTMWCDKTTSYVREAECADFIAKVPTEWDETKPLIGNATNYLAVARRSGNEWFVGALSDWFSHSLRLDLSFLGPGNYEAEVMADSEEPGANPNSYKKYTIQIPANRIVDAWVAPGGGYAMRIYKK